MKTRIMFGTMAAMATLTIGLLGSGVANAGNSCINTCKAKKTVGMTECVQLGSGCRVVQKTCKQACKEQLFGEDRKDCYEECDRSGDACKQYRDECKSDCKVDFLECKMHCVELGF